MHFQVTPFQQADADVLAAPVFGEDGFRSMLASEIVAPMGGDFARYAESRGFTGEAGSSLEWPLPKGFTATSLMLVGCGTDPAPETIRRNMGVAARKARQVG